MIQNLEVVAMVISYNVEVMKLMEEGCPTRDLNLADIDKEGKVVYRKIEKEKNVSDNLLFNSN